MFHQRNETFAVPAARKRMHRHLCSKDWSRLPDNEPCHECYGNRRLFLLTSFGSLPPEIRRQIYEEVLIINSLSLVDGLSVSLRKTSAKPGRRCSGRRLPPSCLSLLQTCRQIFLESCPLFYAKNILHLGSAQHLYDFLLSIGLERRRHLASLHLAKIVIQVPLFDRAYIDVRCAAMNYGSQMRTILENMTQNMIDPDAQHSSVFLAECDYLRKFFLEIAVGEENDHIAWLLSIPGLRHAEVAVTDAFHWELRATGKEETRDGYEVYLERRRGGKIDVNPLGLDKKVVRVIEMDIIPPLRLGLHSIEEKFGRLILTPDQ